MANPGPVVASLLTSLSPVLARFRKGSVAFEWRSKFQAIAFGQATLDQKSQTEGLFQMRVIRDFMDQLVASVRAEAKSLPQNCVPLTSEEMLAMLQQCVLFAPSVSSTGSSSSSGSSSTPAAPLTIGQWIAFLDAFNNSSDTPASSVLKQASPDLNAPVCLALLAQSVHSSLTSSDDGSNLYFLRSAMVRVTGVLKFIYVILPDDTVLLAEENVFDAGDRPAHSQLARGGAVQAAGELIFRRDDKGWYLDEINNGSGHYRPPAKETLPHALELIRPQLPASVRHGDVKMRNCLFPDMPAIS